MSRAATKAPAPSLVSPESKVEISPPRHTRTRPTVAIVYHFLPHYRAGIFLTLLDSTKFNYIFVAGSNDLAPTIPEWHVPDQTRLVQARCRWIFKPWFFQSGLAKLALRKDLAAIIYLGAPHSISTWYSAVLAKLTGKTVLFWTHGWTETNGWLHEAVKKRFMCLADLVLLYGQRAKTLGEKQGVSPDRMLVIYNSLNYNQQKQLRQNLVDDDLGDLRLHMFGDRDSPYAICTARLTRECNLELLLSAQALLRKTNKLVNVVLVGDGPDRDTLERHAKRDSLPVLFVGACYDELTLARLIRAANVTVSPGKIGLTAIHSLTYGTPVITHDDPSHQGPEVEAIIAGHNGDLFRRGDAEDLARLLWKWSSVNWFDSEVRARCYEVVEEHYNPASQAQVIESALSRERAWGQE